MTAAACGGTTTIIPFAAQHRGQSLRAVVEAYHERARARAFVDYGFHLIVSDPTPVVLEEELPGLVADGCPSLKVYMTYDALKVTDRQMLGIFDAARRAGADVFIVHVSCREALAPIAAARARGARVWAETCPQYLVLTAADMDQPGFDMARFICSPPVRSRDDQDALWRALADGELDLVAPRRTRHGFTGSTRARARSRPAVTRTWRSGTPASSVSWRRQTCTTRWTTRRSRGAP